MGTIQRKPEFVTRRGSVPEMPLPIRLENLLA
jgi:hypothetical protein